MGEPSQVPGLKNCTSYGLILVRPSFVVRRYSNSNALHLQTLSGQPGHLEQLRVVGDELCLKAQSGSGDDRVRQLQPMLSPQADGQFPDLLAEANHNDFG